MITRPFERPVCSTYLTSGIKPIFYSKNDFYKVSDIITNKLKQLIQNECNIIAICINNSIHELVDLIVAIKELNLRDDSFFIKKGYKNKSDFYNFLELLSGVFVYNIWYPQSGCKDYIWLNENTKKYPPKSLINFFKTNNIGIHNEINSK